MNTTLSSVFADCSAIWPELVLVAALCAVALTDLLLPREKSAATGWIALAGLGLALLLVIGGYGERSVFSGALGAQIFEGPRYAFSRMFVSDKLSDFFKVVFLLGTIGVVIFSMRSKELLPYRYGEYYTLMLASVAGGSFLVSSNNFLMLALALETLSMTSYVLAGYAKHDRLSAEASLKYILYGSVASGVMLFGISYIYGMAGTLDIGEALLAIARNEDNGLAILLSFVLVLGGAGFKMAAVPFHFWCPDVYQGAPTPITAFLSVVSKAAGFSMVFRMLLPLFSIEGAVPDDLLAVRGPLRSIVELGRLPLLFWILSAATMTLGNLVALRQTDVKRLFAYSSIAHAGYILMGLTVYNLASLEAMLFYFAAYLFMNLGAFLVVILIVNATGSSSMEAFRGLFWRNPFLVVVMFIFLISLTGLPPTVGFLAKLNLFGAVIGAGAAGPATAALSPQALFYYSLAVIGGINTAISLYYYMKLTKIMVFDQPAEGAGEFPVALFDRASLVVYVAPVLLLILRFDPLLAMVRLIQR